MNNIIDHVRPLTIVERLEATEKRLNDYDNFLIQILNQQQDFNTSVLTSLEIVTHDTDHNNTLTLETLTTFRNSIEALHKWMKGQNELAKEHEVRLRKMEKYLQESGNPDNLIHVAKSN